MREIVKIAKALGARLTVAFSSNTEMFDVHTMMILTSLVGKPQDHLLLFFLFLLL